MIFITTGTQEPFDRLIKVMDEVAEMFPQEKFVAQAFEDKYISKKLETKPFLNPKEFNLLFENADLIISHAGMGTILSALYKEKPIIIMPRLIKYNEHRNEHQLATAKKMKELNYVQVAFDEKQLKYEVIKLLNSEINIPIHKIGKYASENLITELKKITNL